MMMMMNMKISLFTVVGLVAKAKGSGSIFSSLQKLEEIPQMANILFDFP